MHLSSEIPLYNHPLPQIEAWLRDQGCTQDEDLLHCWYLKRPNWEAAIYLEEALLRAEYRFDGQTRSLTFPYSLSRWDVEQAVFLSNPQD